MCYIPKERSDKYLGKEIEGMIVGKKEEKPFFISDEYQAEYRIEGEETEFVKYLGTEEEYSVPETIEGRFVTKVGAYAFSEHRNLDCVHLPSRLQKIGAHAFYNCRGLTRLFLHDQVNEIEDGAFKNCRKLSHLILYTKPEHKLVIKNILMDSTERIRTTIYFGGEKEEERAELLFPPYLVEYEENTPARICEKQAYGSGERYRHCLYDGQLNFDQYDGLLDFSIAADHLDDPIQTTVARLRFPYQLKEEAKSRYERFLKERMEQILAFYIKREDQEVVRWLLEEKKLSREEMNLAADLCRKYAKNGMLPMLMEYQKENFKPKKKTFEL